MRSTRATTWHKNVKQISRPKATRKLADRVPPRSVRNLLKTPRHATLDAGDAKPAASTRLSRHPRRACGRAVGQRCARRAAGREPARRCGVRSVRPHGEIVSDMETLTGCRLAGVPGLATLLERERAKLPDDATLLVTLNGDFLSGSELGERCKGCVSGGSTWSRSIVSRRF